MEIPTDRLYTKEHEWVKIDGSSAVVGITDYAQSLLGDIVYVELPKPGAKLEQFKTMGVVESVKAVSDLYAPISGTVAEINGEVEDDPAQVNRDPFGAGWLVKASIQDPAESSKLLDAAAYQKVVDAEQH
jgi:glycine cleavage system H protein